MKGFDGNSASGKNMKNVSLSKRLIMAADPRPERALQQHYRLYAVDEAGNAGTKRTHAALDQSIARQPGIDRADAVISAAKNNDKSLEQAHEGVQHGPQLIRHLKCRDAAHAWNLDAFLRTSPSNRAVPQLATASKDHQFKSAQWYLAYSAHR